MRPFSLVFFAALWSGCASQALLASDYASLQKELAAAHELTNCAPKALALADANQDFAKLEFDEGDTRRAAEHVAVARAQAKIAAACAAPSAPAPSKPVVAPKPVDQPKVEVSAGDKDGDGVKDADDICVNDPEDLDGFKDADGCPDLDDDGDAAPDSVDRCPREPEDRDGFEDADGCPDLDNDRDGIVDTQDGCPNDAGSAATAGCPSRDRDGDGIGDTADRCPDQAETRNGFEDEDGCADTAPAKFTLVEVTADQIVIKQRINFATGKATILADSFPVLNEVAQAMKDNPTIKVEIGGHTDNVGDDTVNQRLSKARADAVFEYLLTKGVAAPRLMTVGYGETRPIDTNMTESGRINNRRVEFLIVK